MGYVEQSDIEALIPAEFLRQALDDDGDGVADAGVFDKIVETVEEEIDAALGQKYSVPFAEPYPAVVRLAAKILTLWSLYQRRGFHGEANPWETEAARQRKKLDSIGKGDDPLTPDDTGTKPAGVVVTEPAKTYDPGGNLMA